ncbi:ArsA family ATPase [Leptolyngbya sp. FACHB-541]|uniref:ArsA family ATPase n=1 Tax=Leptolyngbya sp. FACHB-541 TaxID=2692810 RepID=UPI0018EFB3F8|nr:ArsA family ATPase [Leptolyngbya sp. FACHB-541]
MHQYDRLRLAMFSGKGGVGKTTLSCGFARRWAQQFPDEQILLVSTDPAHSLADVLLSPVGDVPRSLPDLPNLQVRALDSQSLLQQFKADYGKVLELLVERGSFVQGEDLSPVWDLSWPGLDELMGILEIQRLLRERVADRIVVDMAPSGHTLNLFELMDFLDGFLEAMDLFQEKHRVISQTFAGQHVPDQADAFLVDIKADLAAGRQLLQDQQQTACLVVAIAQPMSYLETQRFLTALEKLQIPVGGLFVNHILLDADECDRYDEQQLILNKFQATQQLPIFTAPQQAKEPVGTVALDQLIAQIQEFHQQDIKHTGEAKPAPLPQKTPPGFSDFLAEGRQLILVGGKGGVGKTTVAAAIAWAMAERHPDRNIRVVSIDPAHSLGDALGVQLGHRPVALSTNLSGQEVDAEEVLDQFRADYLWELAEMMSGETGDDDLKIAYGPQAWRQIVSQALPGIDEMLSLVTVMELLEQKAQDLIILDTAPTGHLLRFLEMPTAMADWLAWIFRLWLKYQDVVGRTELMGRLRSLRQRVMQAQRRLKDPKYTEFIGVLQAQSAIAAETQRLTQALDNLGVQQRYVVHNCYQTGEEIAVEGFEGRGDRLTFVKLPLLPRSITALEQIKLASNLLF